MGLITKTVKIKWNAKNKKHYEELGYIFTNMNGEFDVRVEDLKECSEQKLECVCDSCGKKIILSNNTYRKNNKKYQKIYCIKCKNKIIHNDKKRRHSFKKSFYEWCIEKNRQDILDRWDYENNENLAPWNIDKSSGIKVWIKCQEKDYHGSYLIYIVLQSYIAYNP